MNHLRFSTNAGQSIPDNVYTIINYEDYDFGMVQSDVTVGAAWKFTSKRKGSYLVLASLNFNSFAWTTGERIVLAIYKNGGLEYYDDIYMPNNATRRIKIKVACLIECVKDDTIDVRCKQNSGGAVTMLSDGAANKINILYVDP